MTQKNLNIREWLVYIVLAIAVVFMETSCSSLRHYNKVAKDATPRSEAKRNILAPVCVAEFPNKQSIDSSIEYIYLPDTTENNQLKIIIKQLLRQLQQRPECPQIDEDSLYDAIKSSIKIDTVRVKEKVTIKTVDSAYIYQLTSAFEKNYNTLQRSYYDSLSELQQVKKELQELKDNTHKNKWMVWQLIKINWWWLLIVAGVIVTIYFSKSKVNKILNLFKSWQ